MVEECRRIGIWDIVHRVKIDEFSLFYPEVKYFTSNILLVRYYSSVAAYNERIIHQDEGKANKNWVALDFINNKRLRGNTGYPLKKWPLAFYKGIATGTVKMDVSLQRSENMEPIYFQGE